MSRVVLGLDPSRRKLAFAISVDGRIVSMRVTALAPADLPRACAEAYVFTRRTVREFSAHDVHLFIEEPIVGRGGVLTTTVQAKVHGAAVAGALVGGAEAQGVNISRWKKTIVGKGNANKAEVKDYLRQTWPKMYVAAKGDQDLLDAGAILLYGHHVLGIADRFVKSIQNT